MKWIAAAVLLTTVVVAAAVEEDESVPHLRQSKEPERRTAGIFQIFAASENLDNIYSAQPRSSSHYSKRIHDGGSNYCNKHKHKCGECEGEFVNWASRSAEWSSLSIFVGGGGGPLACSHACMYYVH